jgi:hypothetical protein
MYEQPYKYYGTDISYTNDQYYSVTDNVNKDMGHMYFHPQYSGTIYMLHDFV